MAIHGAMEGASTLYTGVHNLHTAHRWHNKVPATPTLHTAGRQCASEILQRAPAIQKVAAELKAKAN